MLPSLSHLRKKLSQHMHEGASLYTGWSMWPSTDVVETLARGPFEAVLVDMQHGSVGYADSLRMLTSILVGGAAPIVRIPVGDFATASRMLDAGAQAIVAPMISSVGEAEALVKATKYVPLGERSYGPFRANELYGYDDGNDYVREANQNCLAFAMIETSEAMANLAGILAVEGIDGVYVGPADLSLALLGGAGFDLEDEHSNAAYKQIASAAKEAGKIAGIYAPNSAYAKRFASYGYDLISVSADVMFFKEGMKLTADDLGLSNQVKPAY